MESGAEALSCPPVKEEFASNLGKTLPSLPPARLFSNPDKYQLIYFPWAPSAPKSRFGGSVAALGLVLQLDLLKLDSRKLA